MDKLWNSQSGKLMVMRINEQILLKEAEESRGHIMKGDTGENLFLETLKNLK